MAVRGRTMNRNELDPEIDLFLEELGARLAAEEQLRSTSACTPGVGRVLWYGRWWREVAPGTFVQEDGDD